MRYNELGRTGIKVSELCLGSMIWGTQNTLEEGHTQIDTALDHGINFIDTAEMYPVNPVSAENVGRTEKIIGEWVAKTGRRQDVVLATKITGKGQKLIREGIGINAASIREAVENSLRRLKTDVIDLYQLHWPNRGSYHFRQNWRFDARGQNPAETEANMLEVLQEIQKQVDAGKIRHFALSNESAWGTAKWLQLSRDHNLPRVQSIQNEYNLLCRHYDLDMAELSQHEDVGLLAFSPIAAGLLSGKYQNDVTPVGSRRTFSNILGGRITPRVWPAVDAYVAVAKKHGMDPAQMALAWCLTRPFMTAAIFGATSMEQLKTALGAADLVLSDDVFEDIATINKAHPVPY
jgi:aryl-alcohol dehydrogenase-like predicted oxidoreductase